MPSICWYSTLTKIDALKFQIISTLLIQIYFSIVLYKQVVVALMQIYKLQSQQMMLAIPSLLTMKFTSYFSAKGNYPYYMVILRSLCSLQNLLAIYDTIGEINNIHWTTSMIKKIDCLNCFHLNLPNTFLFKINLVYLNDC